MDTELSSTSPIRVHSTSDLSPAELTGFGLVLPVLALPFASDRPALHRILPVLALSSRVHSSAAGLRSPPASSPARSRLSATSQSNHHTTTQSDEGSAALRTCTQTRIRARDEEGEEKQPTAQPSSHVSPAMRIYRHALEAILAMLELADLSLALAVNREWAAAVRSMKPINALIERHNRRWCGRSNAVQPLPPIARLVGSPLLRHLSAIQISDAGGWTSLTNGSLGLLSQHAPTLTSLWCELTLMPNELLVLPAKLRSLHLRFYDHYSDATINGMLTALSAVPSLLSLRLLLSSFDTESCVDLSLVAACRSLTYLHLESTIGGAPEFTDAQQDQIRSSLGHLHRLDVGWMNSDKLARFLKSPVTARWQDIGRVWADARTGELLLRLPTLTRLELTYIRHTVHVDFLPQLPLLTALTLSCCFIPADAVFSSLVMCTGITELNLTSGFTSADWSALFAKLTRIHKLTIRGRTHFQLTTLRCFAEGTITQSLVDLTLCDLVLPPSELAHLSNLRRLRTLRLDGCFSPHLADETVDSLSPPTALLPALTSLFYSRWVVGSVSWRLSPDTVERHGSSAEWMQKRMTQ